MIQRQRTRWLGLVVSILLGVTFEVRAVPDAEAGSRASAEAGERSGKSEASTRGGAKSPGQDADEPPAEVPAPRREFSVLYDVGLVASEKSAHVSIRLGPKSAPVEWIRFRIDPLRYRAFQAEGDVFPIEGGLEWHPPKGGGAFRYVFSIDHLRSDQAYDARIAKNWALFRGEDLVPRMRIRSDPSAYANARLRLRLPEGWSAAVPYARLNNGDYQIEEARTRFDRPAGWFAFGKLGVVRDTIEDCRFAIAGPARQGVRRMDMLAMLNWTMPAMKELFRRLPSRFQIVSAGDPMWRGGLSGPNSVYVHADRPLIGEDSTSPLLHELMHALMRARSGRGGDWVVEGIAEYYSIELLRRSKTITEDRYQSALEQIRKRAKKGGLLRVRSVGGDTRAKAVVVLMEIDAAIQDATGRVRNLDDVVRLLAQRREAITTSGFRAAVEEVSGQDLDAVFDRYLPPLGERAEAKPARRRAREPHADEADDAASGSEDEDEAENDAEENS